MKQFPDADYPLLLSATPSFENEWKQADLRVMVIGISTNGWYREKRNVYESPSAKGIEELMTAYEQFYFNGGNWHYGQVFWNYFYSLQELLQFRLRKKISFIWNNVHKVDAERQLLEEEHFNVLAEEIRILNPDVIIGWGLDHRSVLLRRLFGEQPYAEDKVSAIAPDGNKTFLFYHIKNFKAAIADNLTHVFLTYHPNARRNAGIKLKLMIDEIVPRVLP